MVCGAGRSIPPTLSGTCLKKIECKVQIHETLHLHCLEKWQSQEKILIRYTTVYTIILSYNYLI